MVTVRPERPGDAGPIREITTRAFSESNLGHHGEAQLVDRLRDACPEAISRVAAVDGRPVGHILFTPVVVAGDAGDSRGMGLAPMSVLPGLQRRGIGSRLVESGLQAVKAAGHPFVVVLGHPGFYPRFGFEPASRYGIISEFEGVSEESFMIVFLSQSPLPEVAGVARYRPEFSAL